MAEHYKGHRIGSRKATIRRTLDEQGEKAAIAQGEELKLSPATIRGWIRTWQKGSETKSEQVVTGKKMRQSSGGDRIEVKWKGEQEASGYLVKEGDEQSIVRWRNGNETVVSNNWIERL